ncbi:MAG: hypothetical protein JWO03_3440 [Bacteroidetes bacterium]|nr:hypothetical protein [Bacteroidota bacterium]
MKRLITLSLLAISLSAIAQSQPRILCGNEFLPDIMEQRIPGYKAAVRHSFDQAKQHSPQRQAGYTYTIPIVFHVVYGSPAENLDDSIIMSQLQVLNDDYSRLNADTSNTISYFDSVAADTHIRFVLQGIQRVSTVNSFSFSFFGLPDSLIKFTAAGGDDAVDPDHYLNIWIVNIQASFFGQLLGYSYPPDSMANWPLGSAATQKPYDGVVLDYRTVGANNPNPLNFGGMNLIERGRTGTHEVGHYLGLRHIWGDGATLGANDCHQSDGIDDTPFANTQSNFDCDTTRNSCTGVETYYGADAPDMVQNYMDYSAETCMNLFTKGQAELMQGTLDHSRPLLATKTATAIKQISPSALTIYPNPATGIVFIPYSENTNPYTSIQVSNMLGENISLSQSAASGAVRLNMSSLPMGIYTIDITKGTQHIVKRVVVSR